MTVIAVMIKHSHHCDRCDHKIRSSRSSPMTTGCCTYSTYRTYGRSPVARLEAEHVVDERNVHGAVLTLPHAVTVRVGKPSVQYAWNQYVMGINETSIISREVDGWASGSRAPGMTHTATSWPCDEWHASVWRSYLVVARLHRSRRESDRRPARRECSPGTTHQQTRLTVNRRDRERHQKTDNKREREWVW